MTEEEKRANVRRVMQYLHEADEFHFEFLNEHKIALREVIDLIEAGQRMQALAKAQRLYKDMESWEDGLSRRMAEHEDEEEEDN